MTIIITNTEAPWTFNDLGNIILYLLSSFYILLFSKTFPHKWNYINFCEPELEIVIVMSKAIENQEKHIGKHILFSGW